MVNMREYHKVIDPMQEAKPDMKQADIEQPRTELLRNPVSSDLEDADLEHLMQMSPELIQELQANLDIVHSELYGSGFDNLPTVATDVVKPESSVPEIQPRNCRKMRSEVWKHFKVTVDDGSTRAFCNICSTSYVCNGNGRKPSGTSHMRRHISKGTCGLPLRPQDTGTKRRYRASNKSPHLVFDQDRSRHEIAKMVIMHDYPLQMVEHSGFLAFVQNLQPRFDMVNFNTVQGDCLATYMTEKQKLQDFISKMPGKISLSLDMWKSYQTTGYAVIHGQFIDHEYKLHRRLLNIVMLPFPESDTALSHAVGTCLSCWNLDNKLCSITFNQPVSDAGHENLRGLLSVKNPTILNGQLLLGSCLARTLSSMAQDVLEAGKNVVRKIRSSVIYAKSSDAEVENFPELKRILQVPSEKTLKLNDITRWNTTYDMLVAACELKEVFSCLRTLNNEFMDAPTMEDWIQAENICTYLRLLFETTNILAEKIPISADNLFHKVWNIQKELTRNATSEYHSISSIAGILQEKFLKYWRDSFLILSVAVAMDPRFKMRFVEFSFTQIFGEEAPAYIRMADDAIRGLFNEYIALTPARVESRNQLRNLVFGNGFADFDMYIRENTSQQLKSEIDQYLEESLLPRVQEIDLVGWWKLNRIKYPTLSKMACDILSIPLSSVGPDYVFDTVSREMDECRSSLRHETMEALMCAKDWLSQ